MSWKVSPTGGEGAGGWFTPLGFLTFADWAQAEQLPVILVVGVARLYQPRNATAQAVRQADYRWRVDRHDVQPPGKRHAEYLATLKTDWPRRSSAKYRGLPIAQRDDLGQYLDLRALDPALSTAPAAAHPAPYIAFGDVTAPVQDTEAIRHPADRQVLLGEQHRQPISRFNRNSRSAALQAARPLPREGSSGSAAAAGRSALWPAPAGTIVVAQRGAFARRRAELGKMLIISPPLALPGFPGRRRCRFSSTLSWEKCVYLVARSRYQWRCAIERTG